VTDVQFTAFLDRHKGQSSMIPEPNDVMRDSYVGVCGRCEGAGGGMGGGGRS
jgi:hypothetical protein